MKVYDARITFKDNTQDNFHFTKYSFNKQMFKFKDKIRKFVRIFFIKDIKHIRICYVGELDNQRWKKQK